MAPPNVENPHLETLSPLKHCKLLGADLQGSAALTVCSIGLRPGLPVKVLGSRVFRGVRVFRDYMGIMEKNMETTI